MALVAPSVSTSVRFLTTARASASCLAPIDSRPDTKAGRPVGMAEIAIAVPSRRSWSSGSPRAHPTRTMKATAPHAMTPRTLVSESSSRCSGERLRVTDVSMVAMRPISVDIPVAVTTAVAVPRVTDVFWNRTFDRSPSGTSPSGSVPASFGTGALSPVSAASWVSSVAERSRRPSAGTTSPASSWRTSPGTMSTAGSRLTRPSRSTLAWGTCRLARASTLARAFSSWRDPRTTLRRIRNPTTTPVDTSPMAMLTITTATSMMFIGSRSCWRATAQVEGGASPGSCWDPARGAERRPRRSSGPRTASEPSARTTSSGVLANQRSVVPAPSVVDSAVGSSCSCPANAYHPW